jgi:hypothetical protein
MTQDDFTARALAAFESVVPVTDRMREALAAALRASWAATPAPVWGPEAPTLPAKGDRWRALSDRVDTLPDVEVSALACGPGEGES